MAKLTEKLDFFDEWHNKMLDEYLKSGSYYSTPLDYISILVRKTGIIKNLDHFVTLYMCSCSKKKCDCLAYNFKNFDGKVRDFTSQKKECKYLRKMNFSSAKFKLLKKLKGGEIDE